MQNEKNKLFKQTPEQLSPGLADPRSFTIQSEQLEGGGQCGDTEREYNALLAVREKGRPNHEKTNYETRIEKEQARENAGTKQDGE